MASALSHELFCDLTTPFTIRNGRPMAQPMAELGWSHSTPSRSPVSQLSFPGPDPMDTMLLSSSGSSPVVTGQRVRPLGLGGSLGTCLPPGHCLLPRLTHTFSQISV